MLKSLIALVLSLALSCQEALAACTISSTAFGAQYNGVSNATTGSFTTTVANQLVIVYFLHYSNPGPAPSVLSVTGAGTSWTKRLRFLPGNYVGTYFWAQEIWNAVVPTAGTYTLTFNLDKNTNEGNALGLLITGNFTGSIYDMNSGLPGTASDYSGTSGQPEVLNVNTNGGPVLALAYCGQYFAGGAICGSPFTGWTKITPSPANAGQTSMVSYKIFPSALVNTTVPVASGPITYWGAIADAIGGSSGSCGGGGGGGKFPQVEFRE